MKNIEGFELVFDEISDSLLLCKTINGKEYFLHVDISLGSKTTWGNLVEDDDEYHEYIGAKLVSRIKKSLATSWLNYPEFKPDNYSFVLATITSPLDTWVEIVGYVDGKFQLPGRDNTNFVTHWMQIPSPKK